MDWNEHWNLATIPDDLFRSEAAKRSNARRKTHSGGVIWGEHRPRYSRCRCVKCNAKREARKAKPKPPAKPRGRPPKKQPKITREQRRSLEQWLIDHPPEPKEGVIDAETLDRSSQELQATD